MADQLVEETLRYGPHSLQTITVATVPNGLPTGLWVVLIHGGAWRDPTQTADSFLRPAASILKSNPTYSTVFSRITGFASISYRLSVHPNYPQDPQTTDAHELRNVKHPDHIRDVQAALRLLQNTYGFGERYLLAGHSCGATLAFQCVMDGLQLHDEEEDIAQPKAILGTEGIYDVRLLRDTHKHITAYQEFSEGAFGSDESVWDAASPAAKGEDGLSGVERGWKSGLVAIVAHSEEDNLVDRGQANAMTNVLYRWEARKERTRRVIWLQLKGEHDEPWEKGDELARAIAATIQELPRNAIS
ncbi:hypothetical protein SI65_02664 [Aspergillus cristatus]|uniref:Kynurenine formamidase n=1 Tax=Aspergillus cristatus TaxID=573508 RepID=A0A1E3BLI3_ASPCR|nr:hypothetical protein SI65_02664 [Aspergillus cristatus]